MINAISHQGVQQHFCRAELHSHADTCSVNDVAYVLEYFSKVAEVYGFSKSLSVKEDIPIDKAAFAYDDHNTGETLIVVVNQALYFGDKLSNVLLNLNQVRAHGLTVNECPKHLSRGKSEHAIITKDGSHTFPLKLKGLMSYFEVCTLTLEEIANCHHIEITSLNIEWEPYSDVFAEEEIKYLQATDDQNVYPLQIKSISSEYDDFPDTIF
jgi:hypothetical protein